MQSTIDEYIQERIWKNATESEIKAELSQRGWSQEEIIAAFRRRETKKQEYLFVKTLQQVLRTASESASTRWKQLAFAAAASLLTGILYWLVIKTLVPVYSGGMPDSFFALTYVFMQLSGRFLALPGYIVLGMVLYGLGFLILESVFGLLYIIILQKGSNVISKTEYVRLWGFMRPLVLKKILLDIIMWAIVGAGTVLFFIPGFIMAVLLSLSPFILVIGGKDLRDSLAGSMTVLTAKTPAVNLLLAALGVVLTLFFPYVGSVLSAVFLYSLYRHVSSV